MAEKGGSSGQSDEDKTEEPSQQRMDDFKEEGQVAQSREFTALMVLVACIAAMWSAGPYFLGEIFSLTRKLFVEAGTIVLTDVTAGKLMLLAVESAAKIVLPIAFAGFVAGALGSLIQVGVNFTWKPIEPQYSRLDPLAGFFRLASLNSLVEGVKAIAKLVVVVAVTYAVLEKEIAISPGMADMDGWQIGSYFTSSGFRLIGSVSIALFVVASLDLAYQKYRFWKTMRMTKQEVKEELKQREGDPLLKARMRSMQKEAGRKRMMQDVPKADVIVTNPTHIAVAIRYDAENMAAPRVIAKGADHLAQRIKELGRKAGIPLVENVPLARALHKTVKVGGTVPKSLYQAIAEVLAYVYRLKGRTKL
jgi:flagellar biosynthesis protein FlhB